MTQGNKVKSVDKTKIKTNSIKVNNIAGGEVEYLRPYGMSTNVFRRSRHLCADTDSVCLEPDSLSHSGGDDLEDGVQFSIWVSFYEIYNEFVYDLLDAAPSLQPRKRVTLRLSDDKHGNPYIKGKMTFNPSVCVPLLCTWRCCNNSFFGELIYLS